MRDSVLRAIIRCVLGCVSTQISPSCAARLLVVEEGFVRCGPPVCILSRRRFRHVFAASQVPRPVPAASESYSNTSCRHYCVLRQTLSSRKNGLGRASGRYLYVGTCSHIGSSTEAVSDWDGSSRVAGGRDREGALRQVSLLFFSQAERPSESKSRSDAVDSYV